MGKGISGHLLYGATHLKISFIDMIMHKHVGYPTGFFLALDTFWQIIMCCRSFKVIYATHYKGLEILIFLRALGLFNKLIVVWHHQPIITPSNKLRDLLDDCFIVGWIIFFLFAKVVKFLTLSCHPRQKRKECMSGIGVLTWTFMTPYYLTRIRIQDVASFQRVGKGI